MERIHELIESKGSAHVADIALSLQVGQPSVTSMVQKLADAGYLRYEKYRALPVTYKSRPTPGMTKDDVPSDTFGLFCGEALNDPPSPHPIPNQIILFLEVI